MTDEELEEWIENRVSTIRRKLREQALLYPDIFWREIDSIVFFIVDGCVELGDTDWPENLYLGDVMDKHLIRGITELNREVIELTGRLSSRQRSKNDE